MIFFRLGYYFSASPYLCFKLIKYLDITAYNLYCRTLASIHKNAKLVPGIRIYNTSNSPQSIKVDAHTIIAGELMTFGHGGTIEIGEWCYLGENSRIWSAAKVIIGNHVLISHNVNIHDTNAHPINAEKRQTHFYQISSSGHPKSDIDIKSHPIIIKDHVWIGFNSIILKGVTIGEGAIVGAGSIVTKDVPAWTIVAGNPAKVIREIPENER